MKTLKYQLLDENLNILKYFNTQGELLDYTDTLPNLGKGMYIYNTVRKNSIQLA